ncbi:unnamed protein product [Lactuca saligna]|uniref:Uncharacterized protein n=1 Tax=Lactuca saligna TaxID=75948 RepID=A0AA35YJC6_LACSI|nr:unnamed protein product [Lactuca saligna]
MTGNEEPVGTKLVDMEVSIPNTPCIRPKRGRNANIDYSCCFTSPVQRPFAVTNIPKITFQMVVAFDEEALDKAQYFLMEELKKLNKDLQLKIDDVMCHRASAIKDLEGVSQQYHSLMTQYMEKVSQLKIAYSSKDMFAIQFGLHQACVDMKEKYPKELKDKNVLYSYPDAQRQIIERFAEMTTHKYWLESALGNEEMDVGGLKKLLKIVDSYGADEVGSM